MLKNILFQRKRNILTGLFFIASLFPYISFFYTPFDTQPWALGLGLFLLVFIAIEKRENFLKTFPKPLLILFSVFAYSLLVYGIGLILDISDPVAGVRSLWGYLSFVVLSYIGYVTWSQIPINIYKTAVGVWLLGAFSQLIFGKGVVAVFLSRFSTDGYRGLTSLAPEPAFYATVCISLLVLNEFFYKQGKYGTWWYMSIVVSLLLQIILSFSGIGIMLLLLFMGGKGLQFLFSKENKVEKINGFVVVALCIVSISVFFFNHHLKDSRAGYLLQTSITNPGELFHRDLSVSNRLGNPVLGIYGGIIETRGVGFGLGVKSNKPIPEWLVKIHGEERSWGGRIEGGLVSAVYEIGLIGLVFLGTVVFILLQSIRKNRFMRFPLLISALAVFLPLVVFGSIATPLFGLLLGVHMYYAEKV